MSEDEKVLMEKFGITCESKPVYKYMEHRYENLKDALDFAKKDTHQNLENDPSNATD